MASDKTKTTPASAQRSELVPEHARPSASLTGSPAPGTDVGPLSAVQRALAEARDAITVRRVYGEPYEKDGVTVIPAAAVGGGGGGGGGGDRTGQGGGMGFGIAARPVGVFVIKGQDVEWVPAVDQTRIALRGMLVSIIALFVVRSVVRTIFRRR